MISFALKAQAVSISRKRNQDQFFKTIFNKTYMRKTDNSWQSCLFVQFRASFISLGPNLILGNYEKSVCKCWKFVTPASKILYFEVYLWHFWDVQQDFSMSLSQECLLNWLDRLCATRPLSIMREQSSSSKCSSHRVLYYIRLDNKVMTNCMLKIQLTINTLQSTT